MAYAVRIAEDSAEFSALCLPFMSLVRNMVLRGGGDRDLADEIAQETFLEAYRVRGTFDRARPIWPWLFTITKGVYAKWMGERARKRPASARAVGLLRLAWQANPEERIIEDEGEILWRVRPRYRRLLLLKYVYKLRYEDIARLEGLTVVNVTELLRRSRKALRRAMETARQVPALLLVPVRGLLDRWRARFGRGCRVAGELGRSGSAEIASQFMAVAGMVLAVALLAVTNAYTGSVRWDERLVRLPLVVAEGVGDQAGAGLKSSAEHGFARVVRGSDSRTAVGVALPPSNPVVASAATSLGRTDDGRGRTFSRRAEVRLPGGGGLVHDTEVRCDAGMTGRALCAAADVISGYQ